jgi:N-acetylneuraminic acid mutarotase
VVLGLAAGCGGGGGGDDTPCPCDANDVDSAPGAHWQQRTPVPAAIQETAALALGDQVYVLGGFEGLAVTDKAQIYDVASGVWSLAPALPAAVHHANAALVDGTLFVVGDLQTFNFTPVGDVWAYNPAADADWTARAAMPRPRGASVVGVIDGVVYVAGGLAGGAVDQVDSYDPATDTWTPLANLPAPRDHACGGVIDGVLYVAGGRTGSPDNPEPTLYAYDVAGDAWTTRAPMLTGRGGTACGVIDGKLIVVGGEGNAAVPSGVFPQTESYDPVSDSWTTLEPMLHPRHGMAAAVANGQLFVPGGADVQAFGAVATHDVFIP